MGVFGSADAGPGRACGLRRRFCAHLLTVLESRPSSAQHPVVGLPVEVMQSAVPRGLATLYAMRRTIAAEVHRRLASGCNGHGKRRVLAGRWGQAPLGKGRAVEGRSRDAAARVGAPAQGPSPSEGGKICAPCMIRGLRTAKTPLGGKMFARCIPQRRFAGLFGYVPRISCQD